MAPYFSLGQGRLTMMMMTITMTAMNLDLEKVRIKEMTMAKKQRIFIARYYSTWSVGT
jgi:hypothetical protein